MDEAEFWKRLEYRVSDELAASPHPSQRYLWCDGFVPHLYDLSARHPRITGRAWLGSGARQTEWDFAVVLPRRYRSREEVDWTELLPDEPSTALLEVDEPQQRIEIRAASSRLSLPRAGSLRAASPP